MPRDSPASSGSRLASAGGTLVWCAAFLKNSVTGFACFESSSDGDADGSLWVAEAREDTADDDSFAFLWKCLSIAQPRLLFVPSTAPDEFMAACESAAACDEGEAEEAEDEAKRGEGSLRRPKRRFDVRVEKASLFALDAAQDRLVSCTVVGDKARWKGAGKRNAS